MACIDINGKFLTGSLNGVHRTAAHFSDELMARASDAGHDVRLLCPRNVSPPFAFPHLSATVVPGRFGAGQGWEMVTLPSAARGNLLVNFCNLGPLAHGNSVVMIHDAQTYLYPKDYSGRQASAYRVLLPRIARRARRILSVSEFARGSLVEQGVGSFEKIDVVPNGTDHILTVPVDQAALTRFGLESGRYVMVLGSAKRYKNIARVFDAMRCDRLRDTTLLVAGGPGKSAYEAAGCRPPDGTVFTGFVDDSALRAFYENAAVFAFPSLTEGFGLPPIEAMQCGAPVVAAHAGAMPEVCAEGAFLVDPGDTEHWRAALLQVLKDPQFADDLRRRGASRARSLTWSSAGDRLWASIEPLLSQ